MGIGKIDPRLGRSSQHIYKMPVQEQAELLKKIWRKKMGTDLDLEYPKTFNEKIQWYKLYYHHPDMPRCVDKVEFKDYIAEKLGRGHTARLLRVWKSPGEISFDGLPERFVVKSNCQDNGKYIAIIKDKSSYDLPALEQEIKNYWFHPLNLLINGFCSAYHTITPKVFAEEYIEEYNGQVNDYKLWCFNGVPKFFHVTTNHFIQKKNNDKYHIGYYTLTWEPMNVVRVGHDACKDVPRPKHLDTMVDLARVLSAGFPFVRVDFFNTDEKAYLSELTFYPNGGYEKYSPPEFDMYMGDLFNVPR